MRLAATAFLFSVLTVIAGAPAAAGERPYCPDPAHASPGKVPADLIASVAKAFRIDAATTASAAVVRCVGAKLMGCYIGANLVCDKADTRRVLPGATAWCEKNPGAAVVPAVATGHGTIYDWSCKGRHAVPGKAVLKVDAEGYLAVNWQELK